MVWVDAWQVQCCGTTFAVGSEVAWQLSDQVDTDGLAVAVGEEVARRITHIEDHHRDPVGLDYSIWLASALRSFLGDPLGRLPACAPRARLLDGAGPA